VKEAVGLENITTQHSRAEEIKARFDFAVSRAVAPLKDLLKWSRPLLKTTGYRQVQADGEKTIGAGLICLKGGDLAGEIAESGARPQILPISTLFDELYFKEKYLLYTPHK
jgi:16S rRNA (guanine527-N7)-methyltransferase